MKQHKKNGENLLKKNSHTRIQPDWLALAQYIVAPIPGREWDEVNEVLQEAAASRWQQSWSEEEAGRGQE